jgi:hypothetical protein
MYASSSFPAGIRTHTEFCAVLLGAHANECAMNARWILCRSEHYSWRTSENAQNANFAFTAFSEVHLQDPG